MNASYVNTLDFQFFSPALDHFNTMIHRLESAHLQDHGKTEEYIRTDGDELLRLMFQGYLDKQAEDEEKAESVTVSDGIARNHVRQNTSRVLTTVFGKVTVKRLSYSQRNVSSEFPQDAELNLNDDQYSDGVRKLVVTDAIDRSYDRVVKRHRENCPGIVGKHQAIKLVEDTAQDFVGFYEQRTTEDEQTDDLLVLSFDGKGLVMRPDGLREATRKNAEKNKKKQVKVSIVMDFIHVLEYLWKAAHCLHDKNEESIENWVEQQALKVLYGHSDRVARGIKQSATKRKLKNREAIDKCAGYLQKNRTRLCYGEALSSGFPIASGVIEVVTKRKSSSV